MPLHRRLSVACVLLLVTLVGSACDASGEAPDATTVPGSSTTEADSTTTTSAPATSIPPDSIPGTNSASIPDSVAASMRAQIGVIILDVEESRALPFLEIPTVTILDQEEFTARVNSQLEEDLDDEEIATQDAMFTLLGMLDEDVDLRDLLVDLYTEQVAGFYDPEAREMVVPVSVDGITPLQEIVIAHELVHALTDQHFEFNAEYETRVEQGTGDDVSGILALVEGDATYQQFLYLESFDPAKAARAALEAFTIDTSVLDAAPAWIQKDLAFPYEQGLVFAGSLVEQGGLEAIDRAYQDPPISSEQILDPNKYLRNEQPSQLDPLNVQLDGWELADEKSMGEWGVRLLLTDTLRPGELAQVASGWGNDTYRFFTRDGDAAFVWSYAAESVADAEDLTNALITHVRDVMGATGAVESAGGLLFEGGSPVVFIDRIETGIFFIAATDAAAVTDARSQLGI